MSIRAPPFAERYAEMIVYSLLIRLLLPLTLLVLLWRSRKNPDYRRDMHKRLGFFGESSPDHTRPRIWIHAVSVGETLAVAPLVRTLLEEGRVGVLLTSTTPTGADQVNRLFGDAVDHSWAPVDTPGSVGRFLDHWQPAVVLPVETEIWPSMVTESHRRGLPVALLNGRLSRRSARAYGRMGWLARPVLQKMTCLACQGRADSRRFAVLGARKNRLHVTGSLKFDLDLPYLSRQRDALAAEWGQPLSSEDRALLLAGSTHEGEELMVLNAFQRVLETHPEARLILAPRHPDRSPEVVALIKAQGLSWQARSTGGPLSEEARVLLLDTLGEMSAVSGLATAAFIGGSLIERGGHNPLEAAAFGVPVLTGPYTFNFTQVYAGLMKTGGALEVRDAESLATTWQRLLSDGADRERVGSQAQAFQQAHQGSLARQLALVRSLAELDSPAGFAPSA